MLDIATSIFSVFDQVSTWMITAINNATSLFYDVTNGELTVLGCLTIIGLGIAVIMMVINLIRGWLRFH